MLSELTERKRAAEAEQHMRQSSNNVIDSKENILQQTGKRSDVEGGLDNKENVLQQASKRLIDDIEVDNKENVLQEANKRLKIADGLEDGSVTPKLERD
jgi:hypothetical protein